MRNLIILMILLGSSCEPNNKAPDFKGIAIVTTVEDGGPEGCRYTLKTRQGEGSRSWDYRGMFWDRCGKYTVGDTVQTIIHHK